MLVLWLVAGVALTAVLLADPLTTGDELGVRRFQTLEVGAAYRIAQRFRMNADGLTAIEIRPSVIAPVHGRFRLLLRDRDFPNERVADVTAEELGAGDTYLFSFAPIPDSRGHEFQLEITPVPSDPGRGVAFWATKGNRLDEGGLLINERPRWASLAFQTLTTTSPPIRALMRRPDSDRPPQWLALVGLLGSWVALGFVLTVSARSASTNTGGTREPRP